MTARPLAYLTCAALAACAAPASAWKVDYSVELGLGYSDDVNQSAVDPTGQALLIPRLNFDASEEGEQLRARAVGRVEYRDYLQGDFDNEFRGQLSGLATWILSPRRFSIDFEDYAATLPVNVTAAICGSSISGLKSLDESSIVRKRSTGNFANLKISSRANAHPGTLKACFKTPPFPAIRCCAANRMTCQNGKFHGIIARMTPRGLKVAKALGGAPDPE